MGQERKSFLNLAGEFAVASELNRRGVHAAVTYGTSKRADIFAMADSRFFVLTPRQLFKIFRQGANEYGAKYFARHGRRFTGRGVPNVSLAAVEQYEGAWESMLSLLAK